MTTEYMICSEYSKSVNDLKYFEDIETIYEYFVYKYDHMFTDIISEEKFNNIKFETTHGDGLVYKKLYYTTNELLINFVKQVEIIKRTYNEPFIFITVKNEFIKYVSFSIDLACFHSSIYKVPLSLDYDIKDTSDYFECSPIVYLIFDINKYYQDLILSSLSQDEMKNKFINSSKDYIVFTK